MLTVFSGESLKIEISVTAELCNILNWLLQAQKIERRKKVNLPN